MRRRPADGRQGSPEAGFTIVELVVAITLFALMFGALALGMGGVLRTDRTNRSRSVAAYLAANGVVYVQNVPSSRGITCRVATSSQQNAVGYPINNDVTQYNTCDGDVFMSGTLAGQLTVAAEHNVVVVGDTNYAGGTGGSDVLGLIANQFVQIYHPVNSSGTNLSDSRGPRSPFTNPVLNAAILAIGHSFIVQNYDEGATLGTLNVTGALAQKWRGPVGTSGGSGTGYLKSYNYDSRLVYTAPPHALDLSGADYEARQWAEITNPGSLPP